MSLKQNSKTVTGECRGARASEDRKKRNGEGGA